MSDLDELFAQLPIDTIAKRLGTDEETARSAVRTALPALVAGLSANASHDDGAASLEKALDKHSSRGLDLNDDDDEDGKKIVNHVFGPKKAAVEEAAAGNANVSKDIIGKILPIVAPIVLAWLAQKFMEKKSGADAGSDSKKESGGGIGDILGGLVGGSGGLGGLLGGILGGGK